MIDFENIYPDNRLNYINPLEQTQCVLLRMLKIIDFICKKHNITYWIDGGTLLGAVRHKGFIPWDDDVDICMPRKSYKRFQKIAQQELPYDLFLETKKTDKERPLPFIKIRDRFSTIDHISGKTVHWLNSVYIDIFPIDTFSDFFKKNAHILYTLQYKGLSEKNTAYNLLKCILTFCFYISGLCALFAFLFNRGEKKYYSYAFSFQRWWPHFHFKQTIFPLSEVRFEDAVFPAPCDCDTYLRTCYGNYRELPPEAERRPLHSGAVHVVQKYPHKEALDWDTDKKFSSLSPSPNKSLKKDTFSRKGSVFVVSLKSASDRRKFIREQLEKLNFEFEFFDAFIGKDYADNPAYYNEKKALKAEGRKLRAGEVGCALSHNAVYRLIVERKLPYALILEDDAVISADLPEVLEKLLPYLQGPRIIQLERCDIYKKSSPVPLVKGYSLVSPRFIKEGSIAQTAGYLISFEAANAIQNINFPVYFPADNWWHYMKVITFAGILPSQTLIRQNETFYSTTEDLRIKRSFKKNSIFTYIKHGFFTYTFLGRLIYKIVHPIYKALKNVVAVYKNK